MLPRWETLPADLRTPAVRRYYDILRRRRGTLAAKRLFDVAAAGLLTAVLSPLMLALALIIRLDSPGPALFRQQRVTTAGRTFCIFKFRTMVYQSTAGAFPLTVGRDDTRITRCGGVLRRTRLDELPQLFNILKGDMTLVGTRPEVPRYVQAYTDEMKATLLLPAGVTSPASIHYKDEAELLARSDDADAAYIEKILPEKMAYNLAYLESLSLRGDIKILWDTVAAVLC
ncbi:MAG: sugar transferase [Eubacteriales bacterium]|nr:sugar transferase [Eubacteriales bacterium]